MDKWATFGRRHRHLPLSAAHYRTEATETSSVVSLYLVEAAMKPKAEWTARYRLVVDPDDCDMVMHWDGQHRCRMPDVAIGLEDYAGIVGLVSNTGGFSGLAEQGTVYSIDFEEARRFPTSWRPSDYVAIYTTSTAWTAIFTLNSARPTASCGFRASISTHTEAWICGDIEGTTATFRPQYGGVYEGFMMYPRHGQPSTR